ncbi:glycosyltransferase family 2 protein [Pontibacter vulgaris]|uniref:glycosyltransferase family 2 protein n=1 Tax=Pontibacter vulgaris TaxID=2905679 RepID=UPI001FA6AE1F|nr:glycosyltransferase [Pontibacter vulgaris]
MSKQHETQLLVSVIIPSFNHGAYLGEAIESIRKQTYTLIETIVVDDGSTDNTKEVVQRYPEVKYVYTKNQGPSVARNIGLRHSTGEYLVFLDADDYLYKDAIAINLSLLKRNEQLAFVSGGHHKIHTESSWVQPVVNEVKTDHYIHLLRGNYIGMPSTVMYRRWVFEDFLYDTTITPCEDYDLYLRISRKHPVMHHEHIIAAYRLHGSNTSSNIYLMLTTAHRALKRQKNQLVNAAEVKAYEEGLVFWEAYYIQELFERIKKTNKLNKGDFQMLLKYDSTFLYTFIVAKTKAILWSWGRKYTPPTLKKILKAL